MAGRPGYQVYIRIFYALVAVVYIAVGCIAALTVAMRKQEHSRSLMRFARVLQLFTEIVFTLVYMSVFDYMVFLFNCEFSTRGSHPHAYFADVECFETPHLIHMGVAGVTAIVFACCTGLMLVAGCDLNPVARGIMASPTAVTRLKVLVLKAAYVIAINTMASIAKVQAVTVLVLVVGITYFNFSRLPFLRYYINFSWVGGWAAVSYTCGVYCYFLFQPHREEESAKHFAVQLVLYGVWPAAALGFGATAAWVRYRMAPARKFSNLDVGFKLKKVHQFGSPDDVEVISRCMRHFDNDGVILEEMALVGEMVIKCGMAIFPGHVELLILNANFLMEIKRDGPAARTQLQLALKGGPSLVQRYEIFSTIENSKRLKDGQEGQLDLQSYVEFKRNYRAVIRVHKAALSAQREFWQLMQRSSVRVSAIEAHLREMDEKADTAHQVYKRVLERYPNNGKLLRCYGKFLEEVRNDPLAASRAYTEAARNGGGDGLLSLDLQAAGADKPEFLTSMDLHEDACVVINAEGTILMCVTTLLGYPKTELEGANVSIIMPQPFSGRHPAYMTRYVQGGEPHILDTVRDVVALHKERHVFPLQLCVTKLSGVGTDAIFLGLLRPQPLDSRNVRVWVAPNGVILCTDPQFASLPGMLSEEMVGCTIQSLCTDMAAVESLLELCREAPYEALVAGQISRQMSLVHKHLSPVPVELKVTPGGTDSQRIFVLNAHRIDGSADGLMVVDTKGAISFATWDVAAFLGYPLRKFLRMRLEQLLPPPFAALHIKYLKLRKMDPSSSFSMFADRRLALLCTPDGTILSVDQPDSALFGFTASNVVGSNLADCIDLFAEWRARAGASQLELLLLSLLDRELEMPGTSWRVKVYSPETTDSLPNIDPKAPPRHVTNGRSACLQTELVDLTSEHADLAAMDTVTTVTRIVLWRRDLLTGVVELDSKLVVRKADVNTGLIVGLPPSTLLRTPLHRILDIPRGISWDELMKDKKKKSAMKSGAGPVVSMQRAFEGAHPDGGTMKVFAQGVSGYPGGRIYVTIHPDTTFQGARANVYRALGLEALMHDSHHHHHHHSFSSNHPAGKAPTQAQQAAPNAPVAATATATAGAPVAASGGPGPGGRAKDGHITTASETAVTAPTATGAAGKDTAAQRAAATASETAAAAAAATGASKDAAAATDAQPGEARGGDKDGDAAAVGLREGESSSGPRGEVRDSAALRSSLDKSSSEGGGSGDGGAGEAEQQRQRKGSGVGAAVKDKARDEAPGSRDRERGESEIREAEAGGGGGGGGDEDEWPGRYSGSEGERSGSERRRGRGSESEASVSADGGGGGGDGDGDGDGDGAEEEADPDHLYKVAHNQSEFVVQWVRTLARQMTGVIDAAAERDATPVSRQHTRKPSNSSSPAAAAAAATATFKRSATGASAASGRLGETGSTGAGGGGGFGGGFGGVGSLPRRRGSEGTAGSASVEGGFGGGGLGSRTASNSGLGQQQQQQHWAFADRGASMITNADRRNNSRKKLGLEPVVEEGGSDGEGEGEGDDVSSGSSRGSGRGRSAGGGGSRGRGGGMVATKLEDLVGTPGSEQRSASDNDGASSQGDDEATSQGLGPTFTDASSAIDVDLAADARRARLLKRLCKIFSGPQLAAPLARMRNHTWLLLAAMLITHVVMYVILTSIINRQFANVREVHRLALAADRCQLATVKIVVSEFCSRPGIAPVSVCEVPLAASLSDLRVALDDLEAYHQSTYLGSGSVPRKMKEPTAFYLWTSDTATYKTYFDTQASTWVNETGGVWQMGNRFIATAREILYWGERLQGRIADLRSYKFVVANGPWAVFRGYTGSLDYLVNYAWEQVTKVQTAMIIMLVVEAAGVQLAAILYGVFLLRAVERVRSGGLLTGLAVPGPMLRVLATKPVVVLEDSDDEDGEDEDGAGDGGGGTGGKDATAAADGGGGGAAAAISADTSEDGDFDTFTAFNPLPAAAAATAADPAAAVGGAAAAAAPRRYRRMSMDMVVPPPGAVLPGGSLPYDAGAASVHLPGRAADDSLRFGPGAESERIAPPLESVSGGTGAGGVGLLIGGRRGSTGGVRSSRGGRLTVNGKELLPSHRNMMRFVAPLLLWEIALVVIGAVSFVRLDGMQGPLASLNMASHVIYRYTRVRAVALLLVSSETKPDMAFYRGELRNELANLQSEYDTLMYGGLSTTQVGSVFQKPVPASTFESSSFSNNFFRQERCFRWDQSKCYTPDSPYYEVTHHGLDVMLRRIISEMTLLASDDDVDAVYNGSRYTTMYMVGTKDLYEGLQSSAQLFVDFSISRYNSIKLLQTILLVVTIVFFLSYAVLLLRPYTLAVEREAMRLAGLLSHVPAEMDVSGHVRQVLRAHGKLYSSNNNNRHGAKQQRVGGIGGGGGYGGSEHGSHATMGFGAANSGGGGGGGFRQGRAGLGGARAD
ncbi:hypothetical protein PLESTB_001261700 [Pleodorina starrii]|uniref:TmcB/TmcC TPR repeats domain-containing protein n=1 Tax=Pleodorina starrii TaxID=330485 RepID=A0A9W6BT66_9CHLO|nr:hypothetical protein PLESTB_001261700 [Pleodorina starrii]